MNWIALVILALKCSSVAPMKSSSEIKRDGVIQCLIIDQALFFVLNVERLNGKTVQRGEKLDGKMSSS